MKQNIPYKFNPFPIYYRGGSIEPPVQVDALTFTGKSASNAVALSSIGSPDAVSLQYSKNNGSWTAYTINDIIQLNQNETVAFSGANDHFSKDNSNYYNFIMTGSIEADGNIQSILNFSNSCTNNCYYRLFFQCTSLLKPPILSATNLAVGCYSWIFGNCTYLSAVPSTLPATTLFDRCYAEMFRYCPRISSVPSDYLPATTLAPNCYYRMFDSCASLTSAPQLSATTLANGCYRGMFQYCTSLSSAPYLPATTLTELCYHGMFWGCTNLTNIIVNFTKWLPSTATYYWVAEVVANGTFIKPATLSTAYGNSYIPNGWGVESIPLTFKSTGNTTVKINKSNLSYNKNRNGWTSYTADDVISLADGDQVAFKGTDATVNTTFVSTGDGSLKVYGDINSLISGRDVMTESFKELFLNNTVLTDASGLILPSLTAAPFSYYAMFNGCSSLIAAPAELPATSLTDSCYRSMFNGCSSLITTPTLPAMDLALACYDWMFGNCISLSTAPSLPATGLAINCCNCMFYNCRSLTDAPYLPATTLADGCYTYMFNSCTNLSSVNVAFTDWNVSGNATNRWLGSVANNGTFTKPTSLSAAYGISYIPTNWTVVQPPAPYEPLTIQVADDSTFSIVPVGSPDPVTLYYSKNGGAWTAYTIEDQISLVNGDTLALSGTTEYFSKGNDSDAYEIHISSNSNTVKVYGHLNSLINGINNLPDFAFARGFCFQTSICDASQLILPNVYSEHCYEYLFFGCDSLTAAPILPNGTIATACYRNAFYSCSSLDSLTAYFTDWGEEPESSFDSWLGAGPNQNPGTFYKTTALPDYVDDSYGIPQAWTIVNIDQQ